MARPTLKDVAQNAGVSVSTASRALAGNPAIACATRQKVRKVADELGYMPNVQARALKTSRTDTIGVVVPSLINYYFASMVTAIQQEARISGISTLIINTDEDPEVMHDALRGLSERGVDGIICVPHEQEADTIKNLVDHGLPVVLIDRELEGSGLPTFTSDAAGGIRAAVAELVRIDALPIGYLSGPMTTSTGRNRLAAFQAACDDAGIAPQLIFQGGYEQELGRQGAQSLLEQGAKSLLAGDSMMTIGVIEACHRAKKVIGEDVAVVGFDTHPVFELQPRPITVIDQHVDDMARQAFTALTGWIKGEAPDELHVFTETNLINRQSTQPLTPGGER
ncbi:transcriptional regulator UriR [Corynebacterium cystitidis]|nr:LacI family DNA-binding transcriptional regulator [Corynebacterium cystitidis]